MHNGWKLLLLTLLLATPLILLLVRPPGAADPVSASPPPPLLLYCAAGMKKPVAGLAADYEREYGVRVEVQYGGSGTLLSNLKVTRQGDLYLAADASYIDLARESGLVAEVLPAAVLRPVIAVPASNPRGLRGYRDLLSDDLRVALANPDAASIGRQTRLLFTAGGVWEELAAAVQARGVFKPTVNEVANDVKLGTVDAGVVWDATVSQYPELSAVEIENSGGFDSQITIGVLASSTQPTAALRFARYLTARDRGLAAFDRAGFTPVEGDRWARTPEITCFAGGVNRLGIEKTLREFEAREGVRITTVYNGCGILLGQLKLGARADAYQTCDASFMAGVEDRFTPARPLTETAIVIAAARGNPLGLRTLADLDRDGLRLGLANEEQSALGALTQRLLAAEGLERRVAARVVAQAPTADLLVSQLRAGSLDAVIVYAANTATAGDAIATIPIDLPGARAVQTFSISRDSDYPRLLERLEDRLRSAVAQQRYRAAGFTCRAEEEAP